MRPLKKINSTALCIAVAFMSTALAEIKPPARVDAKDEGALQKLKDDWKYHKKVTCKDEKNRYKSIYLDKDVYQFARPDLSDLRVVDSKGDFVPYYIEHGVTEFRTSEVRFLSKKIAQRFDRKNRRASFDFQIIPQKRNISGSRLVLTVPNADYSKQIIIYGRRADSDWEEIKLDSLYRFERYDKAEVELGAEYNYSFYRIEIIENTEGISVTKLTLVGSAGSRYQRLYQKFAPEFIVKSDASSTLVTIKNPNRLKIYRLALSTEGTFNREYSLFVLEEQSSASHPRRHMKREVGLQNGSLYNFDFKSIAVSNKTIDFSERPISEQTVFIRIQNGNDKPVAISAVDAIYYIDRVVFSGTSGFEHLLYFGNGKAVAPRYDIETYRHYIEREDKDACVCGAIAGKLIAEKGEMISGQTLKIILNVTIVLISLLLVFFLVKKMAFKK